MRRVLVAVSGLMLAEFLDRTLGQLDWSGAELCLLHVVDTRPLRGFDFAAGALSARSGQAAGRVREMGALGAEAGRRMLEEAASFAASRLPAGTPVRRLERTGVPEQEIIAAAYEIGASLIVLGAAEEPAGPPPPEPPGPRPPKPPEPPRSAAPAGAPRFPHRHLTPVVRFVVDHAPCDVLLLYAGRAGEPGQGSGATAGG